MKTSTAAEPNGTNPPTLHDGIKSTEHSELYNYVGK